MRNADLVDSRDRGGENEDGETREQTGNDTTEANDATEPGEFRHDDQPFQIVVAMDTEKEVREGIGRTPEHRTGALQQDIGLERRVAHWGIHLWGEETIDEQIRVDHDPSQIREKRTITEKEIENDWMHLNRFVVTDRMKRISRRNFPSHQTSVSPNNRFRGCQHHGISSSAISDKSSLRSVASLRCEERERERERGLFKCFSPPLAFVRP